MRRPSPPFSRRAFLALAARASAASTAALAWAATGCRSKASPSELDAAAGSVSTLPAARARIISLAPAITETLFTIGAGSKLVGVSDYCDLPAEAAALPRLGTSLTPNYEAIARLNPSLIFGEDNPSARRRELEALGPTLLLPWLTLSDVVAGIRTLGQRTGRRNAAQELGANLERQLSVPEPSKGPRILLVLGYEPGRLDEVWFIKKNSLHGSALHAAGARNAVADDVAGAPRLSPEKVLELDPDAVLILLRPGQENRAEDYLSDWRRLAALKAVKQRHVVPIAAPEAFSNGPSILKLVEKLRGVMAELGFKP